MAEQSNVALSFHNITTNVGGFDIGQFRVLGGLFGWKNRNQSAPPHRRVLQYESTEIQEATWFKVTTKDCRLQFVTKGGKSLRFSGFRDADYEALSKHFEKNTSIHLKRAKLATKGWHWGEFDVDDHELRIAMDGDLAFAIRVADIHSVNNPSKTDVSLEFEPRDDEPSTMKDDNLMEVRFALPPTTNDDPEPAAALRQLLLEKSGSKSGATEVICMLHDVRVIVPSARFDINMLANGMKLHGKSHDFFIPFKTVSRMFLLPGPQPSSFHFVLSLDTPLRKGNTKHPNIVIQFDERKTVELNLTLEAEHLEKLQAADPNIQPVMSGREYDVITRVIKGLVRRSVVVPGDFRSSTGSSCFRCSYKAHSGHLYLLNKLLIFITKPVIILRYEEVLNVEFGRTSGSQTRLFEFRIAIKGGVEYEFSSVDRHEYQVLVDFMQKKGVRVRNLNQVENEKSFLEEDLPSEEESDEDFQAHSSSSGGSSEEEDDSQDEAERPKGDTPGGGGDPSSGKGGGSKSGGGSSHGTKGRKESSKHKKRSSKESSPASAQSSAAAT